jgi:DNA-directed RNA polymerase beta' subunit
MALMAVEEQLLNAQNNKPCMSPIQDTLAACYLFTQDLVLFERESFMQLMMEADSTCDIPIPVILKAPGLPSPRWTGYQAFSLTLPKQLNFGFRNSLASSSVVVRNGELLCGILTKDVLGPTNGGCVHRIALDIAPGEALRFMERCQHLSSAFLRSEGFNVGIQDCLPDPHSKLQADKCVEACFEHLAKLEDISKSLDVDPMEHERVRARVLNDMLTVAGNVSKNSRSAHPNALREMIAAKSKGSIINQAQITAFVGQQCVDGHRIMDERCPFQRTLPWFQQNATSPESRGFISHSYKDGMTPPEVYFHAMSGLFFFLTLSVLCRVFLSMLCVECSMSRS